MEDRMVLMEAFDIGGGPKGIGRLLLLVLGEGVV